MKTAVWNIRHNKELEQQKVSRLLSGGGDFEAPDLAVFLEISGADPESAGGVWLSQRPNVLSPGSGIRLWHRREIAVTPLEAPDLADINVAAAYYISPSAGGMKFTPFVLVPFWAVPVSQSQNLEKLETVLRRCRETFLSGTGVRNVLVTGDTNLTDPARRALEARLESSDRESSAGMTLLDLSAPPEEDGSVPGKRPHDTLLHTNKKWYACDLAVASETFAPHVEGKIGRYAAWHGPRGTAYSDHLPLYFTVS